MAELSLEATLAQIKGANAMCPGCKIEKKIPERVHGTAVHRIGKGTYECHANTDAWIGVPEFEAQS